jgi:PAS domain-containing protein
VAIAYGDITERKQAEEALRKTEEKFRTVIENIFKFVPESLVVFTDKLNLFRRNKAFEDLVRRYAVKLNYSEEELADMLIEQIKTKLVTGEKSEIRIHRNHT